MESQKTLFKQIREDWLLYLLFFFTSIASVMLELYALLFWMVVCKEIGRSINGISKLFPFISYILISTVVGLAITGFSADKAVIQTGQLVVYMCIYYAFMSHYQNNLSHVFEVYVKFALVLAIAGIIQFFVALLYGVKLFYVLDYLEEREIIEDGLRAQAWVGEPANFALYLVPALSYSCFKWGLFNIKTIILIFAGWLAFSPIFKLSLVLIVGYYLYRQGSRSFLYILFITALLMFSTFVERYNIVNRENGDIKSSETFQYIGANFAELENANASTYSFLKNLRVAFMADNRITGTGIGTHGYSHDKWYHSSFSYSELNKWDAYSLGTRIFSELGIVGLCVFVYFFFKYFNRNNIINISIVFYFIFAFLRGGHYTISGAQFFLMMYLFTSKYKLLESQVSENYIK